MSRELVAVATAIGGEVRAQVAPWTSGDPASLASALASQAAGTEPLALFDMETVAREAEPAESADRKRARRQMAALLAGRHPLSLLPGSGPLRLHPDAPPADDRAAPGPRCSSCRFREQATSNGNKSFPKCLRGWDGNPRHDPPHASHGPATDCRAWWPACSYWQAAGDA